MSRKFGGSQVVPHGLVGMPLRAETKNTVGTCYDEVTARPCTTESNDPQECKKGDALFMQSLTEQVAKEEDTENWESQRSSIMRPMAEERTMPASMSKYLSYRWNQWIAKRHNQIFLLMWAAVVEIIGGGVLLAIGPMLQGNTARTVERLYGQSRYSVFWMSWSFLVNPGNHVGYKGRWERTIGIALTVAGVLYMATVLGVVVDVIREKMDQLKIGKRVVEYDHTVIMGWTDRALLVIQELILANESEGGGVVVVLTESPSKDIIEGQIHHQFRKNLRGTRIIVRSGSPMLMQDLQKVAIQHAKVSILLSDSSGDADKADAASLRQILTLRSLPQIRGFVVVEIRDVDNEPLVKLVGGHLVETIVSHDIIGRMMVMSSRNPGLSRVYSQVLGFNGDEFYMRNFVEIEGVAFGDLQAMFPDAVPIGIASSDENCIWLKPSLGRITKPGEKIIVIAQDNNTFSPHEKEDIVYTKPPPEPPKMTGKELILFCGWRRDIRDIIMHLDSLVMPGSVIHLCTDAIPMRERDVRLRIEGLNIANLKNVHIEHFNVNTSVRRKVEGLPLDKYTSIMVFPDQAYEDDMMHSDSHAIASLLLIRDIQKQRQKAKISSVTLLNSATAHIVAEGIESWRRNIALSPKIPIICEILDPQAQATIEANFSIAGSSDFCQSNRLIAQVLAMVSENRGVKLLIDELLSATGTSFRVMRPGHYVAKGELLNFYELSLRILRAKGEILVGHQLSHEFVTVINPPDKHVRRCRHRSPLATWMTAFQPGPQVGIRTT